MTRDDWILLGAGALGIAAVGAIYIGKSHEGTLNPSVDPLYAQSVSESPSYMAANAPKTYIPITNTAPCGCGNGNTVYFGSPIELAGQVLSNAQAVLANIGSV